MSFIETPRKRTEHEPTTLHVRNVNIGSRKETQINCVKRRDAVTRSKLTKKGSFVMSVSQRVGLKNKLTKTSNHKQKFAMVVMKEKNSMNTASASFFAMVETLSAENAGPKSFMTPNTHSNVRSAEKPS